ncbi:MAG: hypothetical protein P1P90_04295 [Patescibacteria group bacterium]|nr:hypothetical protein [Patescibacteria group bacterium]
MLEKLFAPKAAQIDNHPEWLPDEGPKTTLDNLPEEILEQTTGAEYRESTGARVEQNNLQEIQLPEVEIPEHLPDWFDITAEALDDIAEETALGNLVAIGKMGAHDPKIIKDYVKEIPQETLEIIEKATIDMACEQSKKLAAHITGRELLVAVELQEQQIQLKKLFNIANCLQAAGHEQLLSTLVNLERTYNYARSEQVASA